MKDLSKEWAELRNVPINENDTIEESFMHFPRGTDRLTIWHWFDENDLNGVAYLMGVTE